MANGMRQMFEPFEKRARQEHSCPCCERSFTADEEASFIKKQRVKASSTGEHLKALAVESSNADSVFQQLDKLRAVFEEYSKLTTEIIPLAEKTLQEHTEELGQKSEALDDVSWGSLVISLDRTDSQLQILSVSLQVQSVAVFCLLCFLLILLSCT
jgi:DNA repair protein RAD50